MLGLLPFLLYANDISDGLKLAAQRNPVKLDGAKSVWYLLLRAFWLLLSGVWFLEEELGARSFVVRQLVRQIVYQVW